MILTRRLSPQGRYGSTPGPYELPPNSSKWEFGQKFGRACGGGVQKGLLDVPDEGLSNIMMICNEERYSKSAAGLLSCWVRRTMEPAWHVFCERIRSLPRLLALPQQE
eukprot:scaffold2501_cov174-Amphora_coffeaeformis.AAC.10